MKKIITFIILLITYCSFFIVNAQSLYFNKRIDITGDAEVCRGIIPFNNSYLVAGGHGPGYIVYLSCIDSLGNLKWTKHYAEAGYNYFFGLSGSLFQTTDKYIAIVGSRVPTGPRGYGLLIKTDSSGNQIWEKEYNILDDSYFNNGCITKNNGFILTGSAFITGLKYRYLLVKTDSIGNQQWYKTYTDDDPNRGYAGKCVIQTPDKGYCMGGCGGYWSNPCTEYRGIAEIIKTDSLGNQQWKKIYGDPLNRNWGTMLTLSKDSCIIATYCLAYSSLQYCNYQLYITKIGLDGSEKWNKKIGFVAPDNWPSWLLTLNDGSLVLSGSRGINDTLNKHIGWLFKLKNNGDSLWYREYAIIKGPNEENQLWQFTPTSDKGFAAAGSLFPAESGGTQDIWVFKTDSMGCLIPRCDVGITEFNQNAGAQMLIYPNPFNEAFAINYNIPKESKKGEFQLYDMYGKLVYSTGLSYNVNQLQVLASSLKAGIYVAAFIVDGVKVCSQKIIKE